ncbi:MAG: CDP-diacylglycerol--glycerol-3-phosphate 3-phosphatidyltransferase [Acidobacteriota bacterium]|nr:CDP-diacylglycerol--glycerol-3-phosphate 3-phosphatidyltransferase [Thermoanaerobaculaceae bacterium]
MNKKVLNIPNILTLFRIFLVPFIVVVLLTKFQFEKWFYLNRETIAVLLIILASITDILDGYLARKRKEITTLGQLLDPIADKLLVSSVLISLVDMQLAPAYLVVIIIAREFAVTGIRMVAAINQVAIPAGKLGKIKMVTEVIAMCLIIWGNQKEWEIVLDTGKIILYLVAVVALVSLVEYIWIFLKKVDLFKENPPKQ